MMSALICASMYSFFRRRFSSSSSFIRPISDASMPPNFERHLLNVAVVMPCSRHRAGTAVPASACFSTARIWLCVNFHFLMQNSL